MQAKGQYNTHVAHKESRQRDKLIMRKLDIPFSSGSETKITPEAAWMEKHHLQWAASEEEEDTDDGSDEEYRDEEDTD